MTASFLILGVAKAYILLCVRLLLGDGTTAKSLVEVDEEAPALAAPVHVRKTWEEVMEGR